MARHLDIACLQTRPMASFEEAIDEALPLAEAAVQAGAEILFLPEYCGGLASDGPALAPPVAPDGAHPMVEAFRAFARERGVWVMLGSVAVEGQGGKIINRGFMIDEKGQVVGRYDKIHMFDIQLSEAEVYRESARVVAGGAAVIHDTPWGRIGHTICYDLRFPDLYRQLAQAGAEVICAPAAFTRKTGEAHWHVLNRARAIENGCYMVSPCAIGPVPGGGESYGHSLVVGPWGELVADGGTLPGIVSARLDLGKVAEARGRIPSLSHDRPFAFAKPEAAE
ncbi:Carbon-nitrogen hydrolase [Candidatus Rhodobacter oscarellae]|uniref:Carbon-nitrogen hydrolase n=1 Tax=Candidatus Rhodobacter oscarellae TaxID=1675527 RepID=A0A0J9E4W7_9RHOB|nr:carbon-nitrogen hydrolase family protein [Candidatus Rhodobacter lobularis]KMW57791.1 Carbon-nitrogen hydrolase [Candidatus Rhodobacter lobularis]